jgi:tetratricopeptide (TPR) repeat protein
MSAVFTRPKRNLALLIALVLLPFLFDLQAIAAEILVPAAVIVGLTLSVGWHFFVGRSCCAKQDWSAAISHFKTFEVRARRLRLGRISVPLFFSLYTFDGVALAKNNLAFCLMNSGELEEARRSCNEALAIDPKYALPHINLGIIAALQGSPDTAASHLQRGFDLGYRDRGVQRQVRQILEATNVKTGDLLSDQKSRVSDG